jgi:hypothetical protein
MVVSPEHPLVATLTTAAQKQAVEAYISQAASKSDLERTDLAKVKTGVFTGSYAMNPVNGKRIPVWVADLCAHLVRYRCDHGRPPPMMSVTGILQRLSGFRSLRSSRVRSMSNNNLGRKTASM